MTESNELDLLMDKDPLQLSKQDIQAIISYQRQARANFEAGVKPVKPKGPTISIAHLKEKLMPKKEPATTFKRRV